ncbi:MAG TPA: hypothetical protein VGQ13_06855 [Nitrososphaera sp.]|nr:hypothetical protein [Nitrososphaera sp.]
MLRPASTGLLDFLSVMIGYRLLRIFSGALGRIGMSRFVLYLRIKAAAMASIGAIFFLFCLPKF